MIAMTLSASLCLAALALVPTSSAVPVSYCATADVPTAVLIEGSTGFCIVGDTEAILGTSGGTTDPAGKAKFSCNPDKTGVSGCCYWGDANNNGTRDEGERGWCLVVMTF